MKIDLNIEERVVIVCALNEYIKKNEDCHLYIKGTTLSTRKDITDAFSKNIKISKEIIEKKFGGKTDVL